MSREQNIKNLKTEKEGIKVLKSLNPNFLVPTSEERKRIYKKFKIIPKDVTVSARKYEENSYFLVNLANLLLFTSYKVGVSQERLLKLYKFLIKHPKPEVLE